VKQMSVKTRSGLTPEEWSGLYAGRDVSDVIKELTSEAWAKAFPGRCPEHDEVLRTARLFEEFLAGYTGSDALIEAEWLKFQYRRTYPSPKTSSPIPAQDQDAFMDANRNPRPVAQRPTGASLHGVYLGNRPGKVEFNSLNPSQDAFDEAEAVMQAQRTAHVLELHAKVAELEASTPGLDSLYVGKKADPMAAHDIDPRNHLHDVYVGNKKRRSK